MSMIELGKRGCPWAREAAIRCLQGQGNSSTVDATCVESLCALWVPLRNPEDALYPEHPGYCSRDMSIGDRIK